jgi:hypothetical protein
VEQQLASGLSERQVAELIENDEINARQLVGDAPVPGGFGFGFELVDEIDDVEEAGLEAIADATDRARCDFPVPVPPMSTVLRS